MIDLKFSRQKSEIERNNSYCSKQYLQGVFFAIK